jgi:tetratricopeptide (TPR) repeat protein
LWLLWYQGQAVTTDTERYGAAIEPLPQAVIIYNRGVDFSKEGLKREAAASYLEALALDGTFAEAHQNVALLFESQAATDEAVYHNLQSIKWSRSLDFRAVVLKNIVAFMDRHRLFERRPDVTNIVLDYLNDALELRLEYSSHQKADILHSVAVIYKSTGFHNEAIKFYVRALDIDPNHVLSLIGAGNIHFFARNYSGSAEYYYRCLNALAASDQVNKVQILNNLVSVVKVLLLLIFMLLECRA